jgi:hypothetical protein
LAKRFNLDEGRRKPDLARVLIVCALAGGSVGTALGGRGGMEESLLTEGDETGDTAEEAAAAGERGVSGAGAGCRETLAGCGAAAVGKRCGSGAVAGGRETLASCGAAAAGVAAEGVVITGEVEVLIELTRWIGWRRAGEGAGLDGEGSGVETRVE